MILSHKTTIIVGRKQICCTFINKLKLCNTSNGGVFGHYRLYESRLTQAQMNRGAHARQTNLCCFVQFCTYTFFELVMN
jgi:hypothetical protein